MKDRSTRAGTTFWRFLHLELPTLSAFLSGCLQGTLTMTGGWEWLTLACPLVRQELVALLAAAFKAAHGVSAEVVAASVVHQALVDV